MQTAPYHENHMHVIHPIFENKKNLDPERRDYDEPKPKPDLGSGEQPKGSD